MSSNHHSSPPSAADLLGSSDRESSILELDCDSESLELQSYQHSNPMSGLDLDLDLDSSPDQATPPASTFAATQPKHGKNWSALDCLCFIKALDNHNPWATSTLEEAASAWQEAIDKANKALAKHHRESRPHGAFEVQWKRMVKDVCNKKATSLRATGANFDFNKDDAYATLYNLVNLFNASKIKLSFLNPVDFQASQAQHAERQKRRQAVSDAQEAGQTGQTLALQWLCDRQSSSQVEGTQSTTTDLDDIDDSQSLVSQLSSPALKRHRTPKMEIGESLVKTLDKLVDMQSQALSFDCRNAISSSGGISREVDTLKDQVSQLQMDMAGMDKKMDTLLHLLREQQGHCAPQ
ncbi:uncharacterized protein SRS1_25047 [Sporisorium reilianum f. sp. reilianum]|uniref:Uncharacterized protein n=1 Tax=Sporisorium reilianum f. sp. reilianum TaxID=72559 RepID=A0A2N8UE60_9BASI|nr:uncharacterized protein SRS1_25047 [Sporisorium reilianum f. sp. reilianum]